MKERRYPGERCCPFRHIDVANQDGTGHSVFSAESGMSDFGIFIENRALQYALWQRLEELPGVTCYTQCAPLSTMAATTARMLELDNGKTLSARLIVGQRRALYATRASGHWRDQPRLPPAGDDHQRRDRAAPAGC